MPSISRFVVRDDAESTDLTPSMVTMLVVLMCLALVGLISLTTLILLRLVRARRATQFQDLPTHNHSLAVGRKRGHRRTFTITATPYGPSSPSMVLASEKAAFLSSPTTSLSGSAVPEIHITFPDDQTRLAANKRNSGHVVVVRIGDNGGVGLAPYTEEDEKRDGEFLPPYQKRDGEWRSLDLERMGGLKEKAAEGDKQWA